MHVGTEFVICSISWKPARSLLRFGFTQPLPLMVEASFIVQLKHNNNGLGPKSVIFFYNFPLIFDVFINIHAYANYVI